MRVLLEKTRRDLLRQVGRSLGIAGLVAIAVAIVAGSQRAGAMLEQTPPHWRARLGAADLELRFPLAPEADVVAGLPVPGVAAFEARLIVPATLEMAGCPPLPAFVRPLPGKGPGAVNRLHLLAGRRPRPDEVALVVDRSLALIHGVGVGDEIALRLNREPVAMPVVGVCVTPEHLVLPVHPELPLPGPGSLGVVFASRAGYEAIAPTDRVNSLVVRLDGEADPEAATQALLSAMRVPVSEVIPADQQVDAVVAGLATAPFHVYMPTIYFAHICLSVLLLLIALARGIEQDRRHLGVLLALGYPRRQLLAVLLARAAGPVILGAAVGTLAHYAAARGLYHSYAGALGFPPPYDPGVPSALVGLWLGSIAVALLACGVPAVATLSQNSAVLLRPYWRARLSASRFFDPAAARLHRLFRLPLSVQLGLLATMRRHRATIGAVLGIGANFVVLIAFTFLHITHQQEADWAIERWNPLATVYFTTPAAPAVLEELAGAVEGHAEPAVSRAALLRSSSAHSWWRVIGVRPDGRGRQLHVARGGRFSGPDANEILVDPRLAHHLAVDVGAHLTVFPTADSPEGIEVEVVGLLDGLSLGLGVVPLETARRLFSLPDRATLAFVTSARATAALESALWQAPGAGAVVMQAEALRVTRSQLGRSDAILVVSLVLTAVVASLFLAVLATLDRGDWIPELGALQALGWRDRSLSVVCLTEILLRALLAVLLAAVAAPWLAEGLLDRLEAVNQYRMTLAQPTWVPLTAIAATLLFAPLGALPMLLRLRRSSPAAVLRGLARD